MTKPNFVNDEYYHIYNRGTDKRILFNDVGDIRRFIQSIKLFNTLDPIGSIYEESYEYKVKKTGIYKNEKSKLVEFVTYCINPNHFHFLLKQLTDRGVQTFMHKLGTGYTNYFNEKYSRCGSLFQGTYKAKHVESNDYLLHLSAYVNLNDKLHNFGSLTPKITRTSLDQYINPEKVRAKEFDVISCDKCIVLDQFTNSEDYQRFIYEKLKDMRITKLEERTLRELFHED